MISLQEDVITQYFMYPYKNNSFFFLNNLKKCTDCAF